jgi:hypothetical protein
MAFDWRLWPWCGVLLNYVCLVLLLFQGNYELVDDANLSGDDLASLFDM